MKLAVSCGDINGVGLEVFFKALEKFFTESDFYNDIEFTLAINKKILIEYTNLIRKKLIIKSDHFLFKGRRVNLIDFEADAGIHFGRVEKASGNVAAKSIEIITDKTVEGKFDAMLTLPISKEAIYQAGWKFPGHTEFIASKANTPNPLMIICTNTLRIIPLTIHVPIREVPDLITKELIIEYVKKINLTLKQDFNERFPKIAVLSLNPHAGESGKIGTEEKEIIAPAIKELKKMDIEARGPFPSDGFFAHGEYLRFDAILSMYHDQGLIPVKLLAMGSGINYTAGLPIIRTSPDHGTAFNIAGKNIASETSTFNAIEQSYKIFRNRSKYNKINTVKI